MSLAQARGGPRELLLAGSLVQKPPENVDSSSGGLVVCALCEDKVHSVCSMQGAARSPP